MNDEEIRQEIQIALDKAADELQKSIHAVADVSARDEMRSIHREMLSLMTSAMAEDAKTLLNETSKIASRMETAGPAMSLARKKQSPDYKTGSFQCKTDCDACLLSSKSILEKTLCYALFARCIAKG